MPYEEILKDDYEVRDPKANFSNEYDARGLHPLGAPSQCIPIEDNERGLRTS